MTHDRWNEGDVELNDALRAIYAAPGEDGYWTALEARILSHVANADDRHAWLAELSDMVRPGLVAAAALIIAASLAMVRSQQLEARRAYASVISASPIAVESSTGANSVGDGDVAIRYLLPR